MVVALSYAEGTAALPETGGAATFVRRAFNDQLGFLTGWALLLDYVIVIALASLFVPHYLGNAIGWDAITKSPTDLFLGILIIVAMAAVRFVRRPSLYRLAIAIAAVTLVGQLLLIVLGLPILFSADNLSKGTDLGDRAHVVGDRLRDPGGDARLHRARDRRQPRRGDARAGEDAAAKPLRGHRRRGRHLVPDRPRRPLRLPGGPETELGTTWLRLRSSGSPTRSAGTCRRCSSTRFASSSG